MHYARCQLRAVASSYALLGISALACAVALALLDRYGKVGGASSHEPQRLNKLVPIPRHALWFGLTPATTSEAFFPHLEQRIGLPLPSVGDKVVLG